jgi:hypothetical protein
MEAEKKYLASLKMTEKKLNLISIIHKTRDGFSQVFFFFFSVSLIFRKWLFGEV